MLALRRWRFECLVGVSRQVIVITNQLGSPLVVAPCGPPIPPSASNCYWPFAVSDPPDGLEVNSIYFGAGSRPTRSRSRRAAALGIRSVRFSGEDFNSVITSLHIDAPNSTYATSGLQTSQNARI